MGRVPRAAGDSLLSALDLAEEAIRGNFGMIEGSFNATPSPTAPALPH